MSTQHHGTETQGPADAGSSSALTPTSTMALAASCMTGQGPHVIARFSRRRRPDKQEKKTRLESIKKQRGDGRNR